MRPRDEFLDYEPLRRTKPKAFTEDAPLREPAPARPREEKPELKPSEETWIHKHGHTVSYAGIFLFTLLVFFRPYELSPSLKFLSNSAFLIAVVTLAVFVITQLGLENRITARPKEVKLIVLLSLIAIISIPQALDAQKAFDAFVEFLKVVLIFIVMINVVRTRKRMQMLWILVLIATCILSINALIDYRMGHFELGGRRIKGSIGGLFDNPNDMALHLVTMVPIALTFFFSSRNPLTKILFLAVALLNVGGIVVTFSRGGFLALMAAIAIIFWRLARQSRWLVFVIAPVLVLAFILFAPGGYKTRVSTTSDDSAVARVDDLKRSIYIAARHPILGVGMSNYILFSSTNKASHNAYSQVAAELGTAAAIIYILFIIAPFKGLRKIENQSYQDKSMRWIYYVSILLQASLVGYMVASFFASVAFLWYIYYLVAYAVCLRRIHDMAVERERATPSAAL